MRCSVVFGVTSRLPHKHRLLSQSTPPLTHVQWKWSLLLQQTVFIQYCTSDWISTRLTLVDTCQVNDRPIWKRRPVWVVFARSTPMGCYTIQIYMPMFISATTRQQISIYSVRPYILIFACLYPTFEKVGVQNFFFARSACESCFVPPP